MHPRAYAWVCAWEVFFVLSTSFVIFYAMGPVSNFWLPVGAALVAFPGMLIAWVLGFAALAMLPGPFSPGLWVWVNLFRNLLLAAPVLLLAISTGVTWFGLAWATLCFAVSTPLYLWLRNRFGHTGIPPQSAG